MAAGRDFAMVRGAGACWTQVVPCPFYPQWHENIRLGSGSGATHLDQCQLTYLRELMRDKKDFNVVTCRYNAEHMYIPEALQIHERYFCPDRNKARNSYSLGNPDPELDYEQQFQELCLGSMSHATEGNRVKEEVCAGIRLGTVFGSGLGKHGVNVLKKTSSSEIPAKPEEKANEKKSEQRPKTEEELEEEYWNRDGDGPGFDWMERANNPRGPLVNMYPPRLTTKSARRAWEKENAKKYLAHFEEMQK